VFAVDAEIRVAVLSGLLHPIVRSVVGYREQLIGHQFRLQLSCTRVLLSKFLIDVEPTHHGADRRHMQVFANRSERLPFCQSGADFGGDLRRVC
jgi:hypothetical protein